MDYDKLFSQNRPPSVEMPIGADADTKYVFSVTYADPQSLPAEGLVHALGDAMSREAETLAKYPPPQGHVGMRELIASELAEHRGIEASVDQIFLSSGAGGAIQTLLDLFIDPGDVVLAEEFSYSGTLNMLVQRGAQVVHVPTDEQGMNTDALEKNISELVSQAVQPKMIYTISVYQNPMGMTLSLERRSHMLEISHRYGVPILENESYADFRIDGDPLPPSMMGMDRHDSTIYVSAYTKLLGCGLRLGFGVVPMQVQSALATARFGVSPSHLAAMAVHEYLKNHKGEYVEQVGLSLRAKRDALLSALGEHFPPSCTWSKPSGGMMVWVQLPEGADTWGVLERAVEADVKFNPGAVYRADRTGKNYLRLTYSHNSPEEIREGIAILAGVLDREGLFDGER